MNYISNNTRWSWWTTKQRQPHFQSVYGEKTAKGNRGKVFNKVAILACFFLWKVCLTDGLMCVSNIVFKKCTRYILKATPIKVYWQHEKKNPMQWERDLFYLFKEWLDSYSLSHTRPTMLRLELTRNMLPFKASLRTDTRGAKTLLRPPDFSRNKRLLPVDASWKSSLLRGANLKCEPALPGMSWTNQISPRWMQLLEAAWIK